MKQIFATTVLLLHLFLVSCSGNTAGAGAQDEPVFSVEVKNSDDHVSLEYENNTTIIIIESSTGIGSAVFTLESGRMPEQIVVRLHLQGLEEFRLSSDSLTVVASVPGSGGLSAQGQRKILGNGEQTILPFDPLWLNVSIVSDSQKIPVQDGYFEVVIPEGFMRQSGNSFEIRWIDFFR